MPPTSLYRMKSTMRGTNCLASRPAPFVRLSIQHLLALTVILLSPVKSPVFSRYPAIYHCRMIVACRFRNRHLGRDWLPCTLQNCLDCRATDCKTTCRFNRIHNCLPKMSYCYFALLDQIATRSIAYLIILSSTNYP